MGNPNMDRTEAIAFVNHLKKLFSEKGVWCTISDVNEPELKFIKIEASIKVKT